MSIKYQDMSIEYQDRAHRTNTQGRYASNLATRYLLLDTILKITFS